MGGTGKFIDIEEFRKHEEEDKIYNYASGQGTNVSPGSPGSHSDPSGKKFNEMSPDEIRQEFARRAKEKKENPNAGK